MGQALIVGLDVHVRIFKFNRNVSNMKIGRKKKINGHESEPNGWKVMDSGAQI